MVRYLNPATHHPARMAKANKDFRKRDIKFPVKTRVIHNNSVKYPIYVSKKCYEDKHIDLLLTSEGEKKHYILIKNFNTFMHAHTLHHGRKHFCHYCLQAFRIAEKLKCHIKYCFKINGK